MGMMFPCSLNQVVHLLRKRFGRKLTRVLANFFRIKFLCLKAKQRVRKRLPILFIEKCSCDAFDHSFHRAASMVGDYGSTACHSFNGRDAKIFFLRMHISDTVCIQFCFLLLTHAPNKLNRWSCMPFQLFLHGA